MSLFFTYLLQFTPSLLLYGGLGLILGLIICRAVYGKGTEKASGKRKFLCVFFFVYAAWLLAVTVFPQISEYLGDDGKMHIGFLNHFSHMRSLNLVPFEMIQNARIRNALTENGAGDPNVLATIHSIGINLYGNILMFVPLGFLFPFTHLKRHTVWEITFPAIFSFGIEFVQYFTGRSADIDDVILNFLGGMIGYGLFCLFSFAHKRKKKAS